VKNEIIMNNEIDKLFEACKKPDEYNGILNIFTENNNINANVTKNGMILLQVAIENENINVFKLLCFLKGIDINVGEEGILH